MEEFNNKLDAPKKNILTKEQIKREEDTTKIFWLALSIVFIFAVPAFAGAFLGLKLDALYQTGRKITLTILIFTFIFSWLVVIREYLKLSKKLRSKSDNQKS